MERQMANAEGAQEQEVQTREAFWGKNTREVTADAEAPAHCPAWDTNGQRWLGKSSQHVREGQVLNRENVLVF